MTKNGSADNQILYKKHCKYIGSIAIPQRTADERQQFINEKFDEMKDIVKGISVVVVVTDEGVKILKENETAVKMAHGVPRILFSSCQPERKLFAYVAKAVTSDRRSVVQVHMFKTKRSSHTKELNACLSKAFKAFADKATINRKEAAKSFDVETAENRESQIKGKRWAKQEIARGHQYALHAQQAQQRVSPSPEVKQKFEKKSTDSNENTSGKEVRFQSTPQEIPTHDDVNEIISATGVPEQPVLLENNSERSLNGAATIDDDKNEKEDIKTDPTRVISKGQISQSRQDDILIITGSHSKESNSSVTIDDTVIIDNKNEKEDDILDITDSLSNVSNSGAVLNGDATIDDKNEKEDIKTHPTKVVSSGQISQSRQGDTLDISGSHSKVVSSSPSAVRRSGIDFVAPTKRFSAILDSPSTSEVIDKKEEPLPPPPMENLRVRDSHFEGYVNVIIDDKKNVPLPPLPHVDDIRDSQLFEMTEEDILKNAEWFQAGFNREIAESVLADRSLGSFFIRNSQTKIGTFVLTVKIPPCVKSNGVGNFLIEHKDGEYRLKGYTSTFKTLTDLVSHYGSRKKDIPVQLYLGSSNELYRASQQPNTTDNNDDVEEDEGEEIYNDLDYVLYTSAEDMVKELAELHL